MYGGEQILHHTDYASFKRIDHHDLLLYNFGIESFYNNRYQRKFIRYPL